MNKFGKVLAVAVLTCTAAGLAACKENKPEDTTPAPAASTSAPASDSTPASDAASTPAATPSAPAETPSTTPAETPSTTPTENKSDAAPAPSPSPSEPAKTDESSPMAPATPPATEPDKKSEAAPSSEPATTTAETTTPAPSTETDKTADATPAPASPAPAAADSTPAPASPAPAAADTTPAPATTTADATAAPAATPAPATTPAADASSSDAGKTYTPDEIKDRTAPPDPVSELAKQEGYKFDDGRYRNKDGEPQPVVTKQFMVDWGTWNGFRRYHDACHVCHGPNAMGSTFAPALKDSLKTMDYGTFIATVSGGKKENKGGTMFVMPSFGTDKNIMCYIDDIYTYIKSRSLWDTSNHEAGMPPGRPANREDISDVARKAADDCTG